MKGICFSYIKVLVLCGVLGLHIFLNHNRSGCSHQALAAYFLPSRSFLSWGEVGLTDEENNGMSSK